MPRSVMSSVLGLVACAGLLAAQEVGAEKRTKAPPQTEKTDPRVDRSITGHVEKVDARDEHHGTLALRSSGTDRPQNPYRYSFQVDEKTRLLTARGKELERGLKSRELTGAEVRVVFVDTRPGTPPSSADKTARRHHYFARTIELINPGKGGSTK